MFLRQIKKMVEIILKMKELFLIHTTVNPMINAC